jgi:hypothetical protein
LRQSNYLFDGAASASSVQGEARSNAYVQQATFRLLAPDEVVKLGPPQELPIK